MHSVSGGCHCGNIRVMMELTREPGAYNPRACDCDFCRMHGACYVSDARGSLTIRIEDERDTGKYRQGSGLAELLLCRNCGVLVCALYSCEARLLGAVNANATDAREAFGAPQIVSPKDLAPEAKGKRWQELWFSNVGFVNENEQ